MNAMLTRSGDKSRDIRDKLNRHMLDYARKGRVLRGRQKAQLMLECLKTVDQSEAVLLDPSRGGGYRERRLAGLLDEVELGVGRSFRWEAK